MENTIIDKFKSKTKRVVEVFDTNKFFKIPCYQRKFRWDEADVKILIENICETISQLKKRKIKDERSINEMIFLGSIILTEETTESLEENFNNNNKSYFIVDGQQRLTSLSLIGIACSYLIYKSYFDLRNNLLSSTTINYEKAEGINFFLGIIYLLTHPPPQPCQSSY